MQSISILRCFVVEIGRCLSIDRVELTDDCWTDGSLADDCWLAWGRSCLLRAHDMRVVVVAANFNAVAGQRRRYLILVDSAQDVLHRGCLHVMQNSSLPHCVAAQGRGRHLIVDQRSPRWQRKLLQKGGCRRADQRGDGDLLGDRDQCEEVMIEHLLQIDSL